MRLFKLSESQISVQLKPLLSGKAITRQSVLMNAMARAGIDSEDACAFCPFTEEAQLWGNLDNIHLQFPSQPASHTHQDTLKRAPTEFQHHACLSEFLKTELWDNDLETLAPRLWMLSTQSSANINALHRQRVKGRQIIVTESPHLHLVWIHDRIFLKPIPRYLLSHMFWKIFLLSASSPLGPDRHKIREAALGYLRTYKYLIRHESDFLIAQEKNLQLIPAGTSWPHFCSFVSGFGRIHDANVSGRYNYGELRLTRLNFYCKIFLRKFHFEQINAQYDAYYSRFYAPLLFVFGILSVILSALQVEMGVEQVAATPWVPFQKMSRWFGLLVVVSMVIMSLSLSLLLAWMIVDEWVFALSARRQRKRGDLTESP